MKTQTRNQREIHPFLQDKCWEIAKRIFPELVDKLEVPLVVALPSGIHPYNRNGGYLDPRANAIVLYQAYGRMAITGAKKELLPLGVEQVIIHELGHWYQLNVLGYKKTSTVNVHKHLTWSKSCFEITNRLFPEKYELDFFKPVISARDGKYVVKVQREGALTWKELHHFPNEKIPEFKSSILR